MPVNNKDYPSWGDTVHCQSRVALIPTGKRPEGRITYIDAEESEIGVLYTDGDYVKYHDMDFVAAFTAIGGGIWCID